jgi:hypothetical protein
MGTANDADDKESGCGLFGWRAGFRLAGTAGPGMAWGSVRPAGVAQAKLVLPEGTPIIRDSKAQPGQPGHLRAQNAPPTIRDSTARPGTKLMAPPGTPIIRDSAARTGHPGHVAILTEGDPPTIRHSKARPAGAVRKLSAQPDTPTVRDSAARTGDPDDGGQ